MLSDDLRNLRVLLGQALDEGRYEFMDLLEAQLDALADRAAAMESTIIPPHMRLDPARMPEGVIYLRRPRPATAADRGRGGAA